MIKRKRLREKGKLKPSSALKILKPGDKVVLLRDLSAKGLFPKQFQGKVAEVVRKEGKAYVVRFLNGKVYKTLTLNPLHLKKLK
ncbi:MAG: 50S ribosomal protein L21e [Candidatus Pacearchaeota archaeon]